MIVTIGVIGPDSESSLSDPIKTQMEEMEESLMLQESDFSSKTG